MAKKKNLPIIEHVEITGVAAEGKALVKIQNPSEAQTLIIAMAKKFFQIKKKMYFCTAKKWYCHDMCQAKYGSSSDRETRKKNPLLNISATILSALRV